MTALHQLCISQFEPQRYASLLQAIVCGHNFTTYEFRDPLIKAGVIHLFVVSGGHLVFLAEWLQRTGRIFQRQIPFAAIFVILLIYGAVAGFQPPIIRGLLMLGLTQIILSLRLNWPEIILQIICGSLTCLLINTDSQLLSLLMSWQASLTLRLLTKKNEILKATGIYLAMIPVLSLFQVTSPFSILLNVFLVPIFSWVILPLSLVSTFFSFLQKNIMPPIFESLFIALNSLDFLLTPIPIEGAKASMTLVILYLLFMHLMLENKRLKQN